MIMGDSVSDDTNSFKLFKIEKSWDENKTVNIHFTSYGYSI